MRLSVIIPSFRRTDYLRRAFGGLNQQKRPADEVVVGLREDDVETRAFLESAECAPAGLRWVFSRGVGVLGSMNAAAAAASGDVIGFLDDDSEPHGDWLAKIEAAFSAEPLLGALGGRDLLHDDPEMRARERLTEKVGIFSWYGKIHGNHHRGCGSPREVDVLKGCNLAVRTGAFRKTGFDLSLRGAGAQPHWELALCLDIARGGYRVVYDPGLLVTHHIAPRHGEDQLHRGGFSESALFDLAWNEHHVVATRVRGLRRWTYRLWALAVGSVTCPGIAQGIRLALRRDPHLRAKWSATRRAAGEALRR